MHDHAKALELMKSAQAKPEPWARAGSSPALTRFDAAVRGALAKADRSALPKSFFSALEKARLRLVNDRPAPTTSRAKVDPLTPLGKMLAVHSSERIRAHRGANPLEALDKARR